MGRYNELQELVAGSCSRRFKTLSNQNPFLKEVFENY